jgi:hypothetical protein
MLKNTCTIEMMGNAKRIFRFHFDPQAPDGEVYDMLNKMKDYMLKHMEIKQRLKNEAESKK